MKRPKHSHRAGTRGRTVAGNGGTSTYRGPRTADELFAQSERFQDQWVRATSVVSRMRADIVSLRRAAMDAGLRPEVVLRLAGSALWKTPKGPYLVRPADRLLRVLVIPSDGGLREVDVRDSRKATRIAEYLNAVHRYLTRGDRSALQAFEGSIVRTASGERVVLLTDVSSLDQLAGAGVLSFESIYARTR
jgi:hypothetical protein